MWKKAIVSYLPFDAAKLVHVLAAYESLRFVITLLARLTKKISTHSDRICLSSKLSPSSVRSFFAAYQKARDGFCLYGFTVKTDIL